MTTIYDDFGPLSESKLAEFEARIGYKLPDDYRVFMQQHNGGRPRPDHFKYLDTSYGESRDAVDEFFSVVNVDQDDFYSMFRCIDRFKEYVDQGLLPIAHDGMGNYIFLSLSGDNKGKIYFWDSDVHEPGMDLYFVTNSFSEFFNNLFEYKEEFE